MMHNSLGLILSLYSCIPSLPSLPFWDNNPHTAQGIQKLRADKRELRAQLQISSLFNPEQHLMWELGLFSIDDIHKNPENFLKYSYHQEYHTTEPSMCIEKLDNDPLFLALCKNARINGYSALGAALINNKEHYKDRLVYINKLKERSFTPTEKDSEVVLLRLYNKIHKKRKTAVTLLLSDSQNNNLAQLPHELKHTIMRYLIDSKKTAY